MHISRLQTQTHETVKKQVAGRSGSNDRSLYYGKVGVAVRTQSCKQDKGEGQTTSASVQNVLTL